MPSRPAGARHYEGRDLEVGSVIPNYNAWSLERFLPHLRGRTIEIGAGIGTVAEDYVAASRDAVLLEPAKNLFPTLQARFRARRNVQTVCALVEDVVGSEVDGVSFAAASFDAALAMNVLEHVPDDIAMLRALHTLLRPGGRVLLFVPALPFLYGHLDARVGHLRRYTKRSLARAVTAAGFTQEYLRYFDIAGILPWLVLGRLLGEAMVPTSNARLYDDRVVPMASRIERLLPPPVGKNLVCIAEKR